MDFERDLKIAEFQVLTTDRTLRFSVQFQFHISSPRPFSTPKKCSPSPISYMSPTHGLFSVNVKEFE